MEKINKTSNPKNDVKQEQLTSSEMNRSSNKKQLQNKNNKVAKCFLFARLKSFNKLPNKKTIENKISSGSKKSNIVDKLLVIIRISGMVKVRREINETLYRMRLRRKYACVIVKPTKDILGMLEKTKHYVSYGDIDKETLIKLLKARAKKIDKKEFKAEDVAGQLLKGKSLKQLGFKSFFRLHPPRKGIKSKKQYTRGGVLGLNKEINKLIERML